MSNVNTQAALARLERLGSRLPSWGFADTGTRFGKFLQDSAALTLEDKLDVPPGESVNRMLSDRRGACALGF